MECALMTVTGGEHDQEGEASGGEEHHGEALDGEAIEGAGRG
jgi:hypothetical protein